MLKIILLDWDGPISNSRTWNMPGFVDPVAVQLFNQAMENGWLTVLVATRRKHYSASDEAGEKMLAQAELRINWFDEQGSFWRTDPDFVAERHLEFLQWYSDAPLPEDEEVVFLSFDDEKYPQFVSENMKFAQFPICANEGIGSRSLKAMRDLIKMTDEELAAHFNMEAT
jgi:hypothetical protein